MAFHGELTDFHYLCTLFLSVRDKTEYITYYSDSKKILFVQIMNKDSLNLKTFEKKLYFTIC